MLSKKSLIILKRVFHKIDKTHLFRRLPCMKTGCAVLIISFLMAIMPGTAAASTLSPSGSPYVLSSGTVGVAYSATITASGGSGGPSWTYTWTVSGLPPGLSSASSGTNKKTLTISGTPTTAGTYNFTIKIKSPGDWFSTTYNYRIIIASGTTTTTTTTTTTSTTTTHTSTTTTSSTTTTIYNCPSGTSCSGGFCSGSIPNCTIDCSKLSIAKRTLFSVLDDDSSGNIDANDMTSLNIRIGFMRFRDGDDTSGNYSSGNIKLVNPISTLGSTGQGSYYSTIYCGNSSSCASSVSSCTSGECIVGETATGGTPLASSLVEAKTYIDAHKASDPCKNCRQKFVIVVSDGADTYACSGSGGECQEHMYERRREVVARTKALYAAGYKVFVVGFGATMPSYLQNTLNWMAYYGGTSNPAEAQTVTGTYAIPSGSTFPSGVTSCSSSAATSATCGGSSTSNFQSTSNDPGYAAISGYAFIARDADALTTALRTAINIIREATYTFTQASVQAVRTFSENNLYEGSFEPLEDDPLWVGHLKKFPINNDGSVAATATWDAGTILQSTSGDSRNIYTLTSASTSLQTFSTGNSNITSALLGVDSSLRSQTINFIRDGDMSDPAYTYYGWKLGDIFHASPLSIATPNPNFYDQHDTSSSCSSVYNTSSESCDSASGQKSYSCYLCSHLRSSSNGQRIVIVGANDAQLHAFSASTGAEVWSFVPPNLLSQIKMISHAAHPTALAHTYYVDGPISSAEIWTGTGSNIDTAKSSSDWQTIMVMSEGRGAISTLWSSSSSCDSGLSPSFSASGTSTHYNHYCGYFAFDITNTLSPAFMGRLGGTSAIADTVGPYLGQPWSKMHIGRVRVGNTEKWVGLIGGGYSGGSCTTSSCSSTQGKGFFVVDLSSGAILWSLTRYSNTNMNYDFAAAPTATDTDNDGFMDTAYIGDTGGNIWRFKFCKASSGTSCSYSSWSGSKLFNNQ